MEKELREREAMVKSKSELETELYKQDLKTKSIAIFAKPIVFHQFNYIYEERNPVLSKHAIVSKRGCLHHSDCGAFGTIPP